MAHATPELRLRRTGIFTIGEKLQRFSSKPFQKKDGTRESVFLNEEKPFLMPLPVTPYELATWKKAAVAFNYHISVDKMYYSVPFEYIKQQIDVRLTGNVVRLPYARFLSRFPQYSYTFYISIFSFLQYLS